MTSLTLAKKTLLESDFTFVAVKDGVISSSERRGVAPIMEKLGADISGLTGAFVADRVIGKAAALLLVYGKIDSLYADIISSYAAEVLKSAQIPFEYGKLVDHIINRDGTDMCPMEKLVLTLDDPKEAYEALLAKIQKQS